MKKIIGIIAAFLSVMSVPVAAQQPLPLFAGSEPIHLVITAPLSGLIRNRETSAQVQGTMSDPGGQSLPISISLRGLTRRTADICNFPPLRIAFARSPEQTSLFRGQKKLKLVTHCRTTASFQQYVLLEYSAYRMYNILTPLSFRVRLANIDYRDENGRPIISRVGYFIEDLSDVAKRNGTRETRAPELIPIEDLSAADAARYAMFEHMIANHDWSMRAGPAGHVCCHNAELVGSLGPGSTIPIPYDFDFSGFVSPPYATPPDALHLSSVRQRRYRGYCAHNSQALAAARQMREARPQLTAAITTTPGLDARTQARALSFLDGFFAEIATDDMVKSRVLVRCIS